MLWQGFVLLTLRWGVLVPLFPRFGALPWWLQKSLQYPKLTDLPTPQQLRWGRKTVDESTIVYPTGQRAEARY